MDLEVDGEIRTFNEGRNDSRDTKGIGRARVRHEPLECVVFTRCYSAVLESSHDI